MNIIIKVINLDFSVGYFTLVVHEKGMKAANPPQPPLLLTGCAKVTPFLGLNWKAKSRMFEFVARQNV